MKQIRIILVALMAVILFAACDEGNTSATEKENRSNDNNYEQQVARQPAKSMDYSPTREGLNKWQQTWEEPGKIAYVYLYGANGEDLGYFVLEGLPVSYCASLTPTQRIVDSPRYTQDHVMNSPSMDGVYYSGNNCIQFFGFDAETGAYLEWSAGGSFNFFVSDSPLNRPNSQPLGDATIEDGQQQEQN